MVARQERLERHRRRDVAGITRQHVVQRELRFERRFECAAGVELQGPRQPSPERIGDGLAAAHDGVLGGRRQQRRQIAKVVVAERPSEDQGKRDHANLHDVGAMVQARGACPRRDGDAQVLPQPLPAVGKRLDGCAEHVLDEHDARVGRHQDAFRGQRAVADVARVLVKHRDGGDNLSQQAQRGVDVQVEIEGVRDLENSRQPRALDRVADQRERGAVVEPIYTADARIVGVTEVGKSTDPFAEGEIKARRGDQRVLQPQRLDELGARRFARALAEPIGETGSRGAVRQHLCCGCGCHFRWSGAVSVPGTHTRECKFDDRGRVAPDLPMNSFRVCCLGTSCGTRGPPPGGRAITSLSADRRKPFAARL